MRIERERERGHVWMLVLFALVLLLMLVAIVFGARIYSASVATCEADTNLRTVEGVILSTLKDGDSDAKVSVDTAPEGSVLRITEGASSYETRLYLHDGQLVEEYAQAGTKLAPQDATFIARLSRFEVIKRGARLTIDTDLGTFVDTLRTGGNRS